MTFVLLLLKGSYLEDADYYIENNGRIVTDEDILVNGNNYYVRLRVPGGKGGVYILNGFVVFLYLIYFCLSGHV